MSKKGQFGEPWVDYEVSTIVDEDGEKETRAAVCVNALDGCAPEEVPLALSSARRALEALLAPEPGGAELRFQAYNHLRADLRRAAPHLFEEEGR